MGGTMLEKFLTELDLDGGGTESPRRDMTGKLLPFAVLGDANDFEHMLKEEEDMKTSVNASPAGVPMMPPDGRVPEAIAAYMQTDEVLAPAILKAYQECVQEREDLLQKVDTMKLSRTQPMALASTWNSGGSTRKTGSETLDRKRTVGEKIIAGSQERSLKKYEKYTTTWSDYKEKVSLKVGRLENDLVFERGPEFRRKKEELEMLDLAIPLHERHGADQWTMSLRNNWTRYVPVGNIFSGLFCPVEDKPTIEYLEQITKPVDHKTLPAITEATERVLQSRGKHTLQGSISLAKRGRSWLDSKYLQRRRIQYSKNIVKVKEHSVGSDTISVLGESIERRIEMQAQRDITIRDIEEKLSETNPEVYALLSRNRDVREKFSTVEREKLLMEAERAKEEEASVKEGPHVECSSHFLKFKNLTSKSSHQTITLSNDGTTAVRYTWRRMPRTSIFDGSDQDVVDTSKNVFMLSNQSGILLPGEPQVFDFCFKPSASGQFKSEWMLETEPKLVVPLPPVVLKGTAFMDDYEDGKRTDLLQSLEDKIKRRVTAYETARILAEIPEPSERAAEDGMTEAQAEQQSKFLAGNFDGFETYFYNAEDYDTLNGMYKQYLAPPAEEPESEDTGEGEEAAAGGEEDQEASEPKASSAEWSGSVSDFLESMSNLDDTPELGMTKDQIYSKVGKVLNSMKIPRDKRTVHYRTIYCLLGSIANAIEKRLINEPPKATPQAEADAKDAQPADGAEGADGAEASAEPSEQTGDGEGTEPQGEEGGEGAEEGEKAADDAEENAESNGQEVVYSEAEIKALDEATRIFNTIDDAVEETCSKLEKEFESQYCILTERAAATKDSALNEHLLWEAFRMARQKQRILD